MSSRSSLSVSAPGKLFLFGEYSVLAGGWSVVTAVDRRVHARRGADREEYAVEGAPFDGVDFARVVLNALRAAGRAGELDPADLHSDVSELYENDRKLGLGSSAASAVALTAAVALDGDGDWTDEEREFVFECAEAAHRSFQGGRGSGAGLAAATWGGTLAYRPLEPVEPFSTRLDPGGRATQTRRSSIATDPLELPPDVRIQPVWLEEEADTSDFIARIERAMAEDREPVYDALRAIAEASEMAMDAAGRHSGRALVGAVDYADETMEYLGEVSGAPIIVDAHRRLREVAVSARARVKPSGAGGGDVSLVVGDRTTDWSRLDRQLERHFEPLELDLGAAGLRREG